MTFKTGSQPSPILRRSSNGDRGSDFAINALTLPSITSLETLRFVEKVSENKVSLTAAGRSFISDYLFKTFNQTTALFRARNTAKGNKSVERGNKKSLFAS